MHTVNTPRTSSAPARESSIVSEYCRTHRDLMHLSQNCQTTINAIGRGPTLTTNQIGDSDDNDNDGDVDINGGDYYESDRTTSKPFSRNISVSGVCAPSKECKRNVQEKNTCFSIDIIYMHRIHEHTHTNTQ